MRWKQWLVAIVLLIVAAGIVAYGLGERLPVEHTNVTAETINAKPAKVWGLLTNVDAQPTWRSGLKSVDDLPADAAGHQRWVEHYTGAEMAFTQEAVTPISQRVVRLDPMGKAAMDGDWTYQLMPMDDGRTTVSITEHAHLYSPIYRFIAHYVMGDTFNQKRYLGDLKTAAEK